jgi:hypothetical protein
VYFVGLYCVIISMQLLHEWMPAQEQCAHVRNIVTVTVVCVPPATPPRVLDKMLVCVSFLMFCCQQQ